MHIDWDISLTTLISWLLMAGGFVFAAGRLANVLSALAHDLSDLKADFRRHLEDDGRRFDKIQETLLELVRDHKI